VEEALARLREARPHLESRLDRAATIVVVHLSSAARTRPIRCRIRKDGRRAYLVSSLTSGGAVYEVSPLDWSCSCPDYRRRGAACKHGIAAWILANAAPRTVPQTSEETAQSDEGDGEGAEASEPQQEPSGELTYDQVEAWLKAQRWIFAKTRPDNPHSYTLKRNTDDPEMFDLVVRFINEKGMNYVWWGATYRQLVAHGHCHWTMSGPGQAILVNRKDLEQVKRDELRNKGGNGIQWRWLHGNVEEDRTALRREEQGQYELGSGG